ncbi:hypothetical protein HZC21_02255 [Candidatus Peregrinibacteria bacterium]|nr:hypothetical protein [Candidatus Peregrinibacteria bacterium]
MEDKKGQIEVPERQIQRLSPGRPRKDLVSELTANVSQMCDGCIYNSRKGCIPMRRGQEAPCCTTDEHEIDFSSGQMFSAALLEE